LAWRCDRRSPEKKKAQPGTRANSLRSWLILNVGQRKKMKTRLTLLVFVCAAFLTRADEARPVPILSKSIVEYVLRISGHAASGWTLYHFRELNSALARFASQERGGNTKCLVVPDVTGYAVVWIRSDWEEPITEAQKTGANAIIESYLAGADCARITKELAEEKKPNQSPDPTPPSGAGHL
jgi:hypothetical protein